MYGTKVPIGRTQSSAWIGQDHRVDTTDDGPIHFLRAVLSTARRHALALIVWIAICLGGAALNAHLTPSTYTATATILLDPRRPPSTTQPDSGPAALLDINRADGEIQVLKSERLLRVVFDGLALEGVGDFGPRRPGALARARTWIEHRLGMAPPSEATVEETRQVSFTVFAEHVSTRRIGQSYVVEVSCWSTDPTLSRKIANAVVSAYLLRSVTLKAEAAENGSEFIQSRVSALSAQVRSARAAVAAGDLPTSAIPDADARVLGAALQPLQRSAPRTSLILALGGIVGVASAALLLGLRQALDRTVRTPEDVAHWSGLACLGTLPEARQLARRRGRKPERFPALPGPDSEPLFWNSLRDVRNAMFLAVETRERSSNDVVAILPCSLNSGGSTVCSGLARVLQQSGQPTVVIDADMRGCQPTTGDRLPVRIALSDVLGGRAPVDALAFFDMDGISFVRSRPAGVVAAPDVYLGASRMRDVVKSARDRGFVLIDLPPVSLASDAKAAALQADAVILVARAAHTTQAELASVARSLEAVGANVIGVLLNRVKT